MSKNKGFTLIELLIVIAIIGVLSSIVITSLSKARYRANDAAIKADLSGLRAAAEIYHTENNDSYGTQSYTTDCGGVGAAVFSDSNVQKYIDHAVENSGQTTTTAAKCVADSNYYLIAVQFRSNSSTGWCVDSFGVSRLITWSYFVATDTNCNQANSY